MPHNKRGLRLRARAAYIVRMIPMRILHVEDDPDDAFFLFRAMKNAKPDCELHLAQNGEKAIDYLRHAGVEEKSDAHPVPDLMILDLKMPGLSGFEVLSWTRNQAAFKTLPVIVLSGSSLEEDQQRAAKLGATDFIVKHSDYEQIARHVVQFLAGCGLSRPVMGKA